MRLCALAESSTERSAASDITLVLLSRSPVLTTQITSVFPAANSHMWKSVSMSKQGHKIRPLQYQRCHVQNPMNMLKNGLYNHMGPSFKRV